MKRNIVLSLIFIFFAFAVLHATFIEVEKEPVAIKKVEPKYPEKAYREGIEGQVVVAILVGLDGKPKDARILKTSNEIFNDAAIEAAKQWLFSPAILNKKPVKFWLHVPMDFKLMKKDSLSVIVEPEAVMIRDSATSRTAFPQNKPEIVINISPGDLTDEWPNDEEPGVLKKVEAIYPREAFERKIEGRVIVAVLIDEKGKVESFKIVKSTNEIFNNAAVEAAKQWVFKSPIYEGKPVKFWYNAPIGFKIE